MFVRRGYKRIEIKVVVFVKGHISLALGCRDIPVFFSKTQALARSHLQVVCGRLLVSEVKTLQMLLYFYSSSRLTLFR